MKKTLKLAGILCLVASAFNIVSLVVDILAVEFSVYIVVMDSVATFLSILTGIIYLVSLKKTEDEIIKRNGLYFTLLILNIFNSLVVWFISFWVSMSVNSASLEKKAIYLNRVNENSNGQENNVNMSSENIAVTQNVARLTERLNELEELKRTKQITEEEYASLRKKLLESL